MNLNELLHIEQRHLMLRQMATSATETLVHSEKLAAVRACLATHHYNHRPYAHPAAA